VPKAFLKLPLGVSYPDDAKVAECEGATVGEALDDLLAREPRLRPRVYKEDGRLFVGIFLNGRNVRQLQGMDTPLNDGDELRLMPPIAGG
jgi:molybdopterin synthase sulfur carrier subunit